MKKSNKHPSAHDVAKMIGVSQSVVSRAFTPGASISKENRERVLEAARKIGYRPNLVARSLIKGRSGLIGLVVGNPRNPSCIAALEALSALLAKAGKHILIFATENADYPADVHIEDLMQYKVDALVLLSASMSSTLADHCRNSGIPIISSIRVGHEYRGMAIVTGDNRKGAAAIAEHLVKQGYRRLAYLATFKDSPTSSDRETAFRDKAVELGVSPPTVILGHFMRHRAMEAVRAILSRPDRPDAIFCANDYLAIATIEVARYEFGLEVGRDLGVVGFDDIEEAGWPFYDLTTYSQPIDVMINHVVDLLLQDGPPEEAPHIIVPGELIARGSTRRS